MFSYPVNVRAPSTYHSLRWPHPLPCGPFCGVEAQRNLSSCLLQISPSPPVYFLSLQAACESAIQRLARRPRCGSVRGGDVRPYLSAALGCCNHSLVIRSFTLQTSVDGLHCLCGQHCRSLGCLGLSSPGSAAASVLHGGTVLPNKESEWILETFWRLLPLPPHPPARLSCSGTKSALVHLCRHPVLTSTLTQLPLLRRGGKSMTRSLVIRIWPSTSG